MITNTNPLPIIKPTDYFANLFPYSQSFRMPPKKKETSGEDQTTESVIRTRRMIERAAAEEEKEAAKRRKLSEGKMEKVHGSDDKTNGTDTNCGESDTTADDEISDQGDYDEEWDEDDDDLPAHEMSNNTEEEEEVGDELGSEDNLSSHQENSDIDGNERATDACSDPGSPVYTGGDMDYVVRDTSSPPYSVLTPPVTPPTYALTPSGSLRSTAFQNSVIDVPKTQLSDTERYTNKLITGLTRMVRQTHSGLHSHAWVSKLESITVTGYHDLPPEGYSIINEIISSLPSNQHASVISLVFSGSRRKEVQHIKQNIISRMISSLDVKVDEMMTIVKRGTEAQVEVQREEMRAVVKEVFESSSEMIVALASKATLASLKAACPDTQFKVDKDVTIGTLSSNPSIIGIASESCIIKEQDHAEALPLVDTRLREMVSTMKSYAQTDGKDIFTHDELKDRFILLYVDPYNNLEPLINPNFGVEGHHLDKNLLPLVMLVVTMLYVVYLRETSPPDLAISKHSSFLSNQFMKSASEINGAQLMLNTAENIIKKVSNPGFVVELSHQARYFYYLMTSENTEDLRRDGIINDTLIGVMSSGIVGSISAKGAPYLQYVRSAMGVKPSDDRKISQYFSDADNAAKWLSYCRSISDAARSSFGQ